MQRYFIPEVDWTDELVRINGDDAHHITRVMRFTIDDHIICNRPDGKAAICEIVRIDPSAVQAVIKEWLVQDVELPVHVTIAQGLPKGDKLELVLQKGTELGANGFIPFKAERSVVKWDDKKAEKRLLRFSKILKEASEQSHRNKIPFIKSPMSMKELLNESNHYDIKIFAYEEEAKTTNYQSFSTIVNELKANQTVLVCIGPEGGYSKQEVVQLKESGFIPVRLGPRILRTETAALYVLSSISYHMEELRCQ